LTKEEYQVLTYPAVPKAGGFEPPSAVAPKLNPDLARELLLELTAAEPKRKPASAVESVDVPEPNVKEALEAPSVELEPKLKVPVEASGSELLALAEVGEPKEKFPLGVGLLPPKENREVLEAVLGAEDAEAAFAPGEDFNAEPNGEEAALEPSPPWLLSPPSLLFGEDAGGELAPLNIAPRRGLAGSVAAGREEVADEKGDEENDALDEDDPTLKVGLSTAPLFSLSPGFEAEKSLSKGEKSMTRGIKSYALLSALQTNSLLVSPACF